jgi:hypothetical protein
MLNQLDQQKILNRVFTKDCYVEGSAYLTDGMFDWIDNPIPRLSPTMSSIVIKMLRDLFHHEARCGYWHLRSPEEDETELVEDERQIDRELHRGYLLNLAFGIGSQTIDQDLTLYLWHVAQHRSGKTAFIAFPRPAWYTLPTHHSPVCVFICHLKFIHNPMS